MKVCVLTTSFPRFKGDAMGNFVLKLVESLSKKSTIQLVTPYYSRKRLDYKLERGIFLHRFAYFFPKKLQKLNEDGGLPQNFKKSFLAKIQFPFFVLSFLMKSLKASKKSDIIHAQWALSAFVGVLVKKIRKIPLIVTIRGDDMNLALKYNFTKKIFKYILKNCDYITANNQAQADRIRQLGFSNVDAVPNGVDIELFRPYDNKISMKRRLGFLSDKKIILFVGWLIKRKGAKYLIDAFSGLNIKNKLLLLIGDGSEKVKLKEHVKRLGLDDNVIFLGSIPHREIANYMNASDVFVLPSLGEGRPNVVAEAMACGIPVIATDVGGTRELVKDRKTGFLIKPRDKLALKKSMETLLLKPDLSVKISKNARNFILDSNLSWESCSEKYLMHYRKLIGKVN